MKHFNKFAFLFFALLFIVGCKIDSNELDQFQEVEETQEGFNSDTLAFDLVEHINFASKAVNDNHAYGLSLVDSLQNGNFTVEGISLLVDLRSSPSVQSVTIGQITTITTSYGSGTVINGINYTGTIVCVFTGLPNQIGTTLQINFNMTCGGRDIQGTLFYTFSNSAANCHAYMQTVFDIVTTYNNVSTHLYQNGGDRVLMICTNGTATNIDDTILLNPDLLVTQNGNTCQANVSIPLQINQGCGNIPVHGLCNVTTVGHTGFQLFDIDFGVNANGQSAGACDNYINVICHEVNCVGGLLSL